MHYLAFTLGPIFDTLKQARKTRELWAASYIFSALMRELLDVIKDNNNVELLLAPQVHYVAKENRKGAGIYPDRCFFKTSGEISEGVVKSIIREAFGKLGQAIPGLPANIAPNFRVFAAQVSLDESSPKSPILELNNILDGLEMQGLVPEGPAQLVTVLERNIQNVYIDGGKNDVFIAVGAGGQQRLPSLIELATAELNKDPLDTKSLYHSLLTGPTNKAILQYQADIKNGVNKAERHESDAQEMALLNLKSSFGDEIKFRHKYVCFVKADGDSVGATIGDIGNNQTNIQEFSKLLGKFAADAVDEIIAYNAIPVYAGGDDLLFIAPLQNAKGAHIFDLIKQIDAVFPVKALVDLGKEAKPSMSYGISISYYKYPMFESLDAMDDLLFGEAKHFTGKNAVAFRVLKHSGQAFGATLGKPSHGADENSFSAFSNLLTECRKQDTSFLTSVMHKLSDLELFLEDALQHSGTPHFFKHHFNEQDHAGSAANNYLKLVRGFCESAWKDETARKNIEKETATKRGEPTAEIEKIIPDIKAVSNQIFASLRFIQFLNQEDHD